MKKIMLLFILICVELFAEKPIIIWYKTDIPPFYIKDGKFKDKGAGDEIQKLFQKEFPEYENKTIYANEKRRITDLVESENFVTFGLLTEERKKIVNHTKPIAVVKMAELIYKKKNKYKFEKYINSNGEISLEKLIEGGEVIIGYIKDREFSEKINNILAKNVNNPKLQPIMTQNAVEGNIKKLALDRVECIIESGTVVEYNKRLDNLQLDYTKARIEGVPEYTYIYAIFSKNKFGEEAKERIDKLMDKIRYTDSYIDLINRWTTKEDEYIKIYREGMNLYFEDRKKKESEKK